jgi:hypothetical protein
MHYVSVRCELVFINIAYENFCRALVQAVSSRLPTAAARVGSKVKSCGICVDKLALG